MNQLVQANQDSAALDGRNTRHAGRRRQLMDDAIQYVFSNGLSGLSIRPMAEALGISHRTLLHHFGSKEQMVARVLAEVRARQLEGLFRQRQAAETDPLRMLDVGWQNLSAEDRLPFWRAFFEVYGIAVKHPDRYADFLDDIVKAWLPQQTRAVLAAGVPAKKAPLLATMMQATMRGLILDLLTTGDRKRVEASYMMFRDILRRELEAARTASKP